MRSMLSEELTGINNLVMGTAFSCRKLGRFPLNYASLLITGQEIILFYGLNTKISHSCCVHTACSRLDCDGQTGPTKCYFLQSLLNK